MGKHYAGHTERDAIEAESAWEDRDLPKTMHAMLADVKDRFGTRPAFSYQLTSGPTDPNETLSWNDVYDRSCQTANLLRGLGVGEDDVVAYVLPNATAKTRRG